MICIKQPCCCDTVSDIEIVQKLKEELAKCRKMVESDMAARYDSLQVGTAKIAAENERLLIEIQREREQSGEASLTAQNLAFKNEQLTAQIGQLEQTVQKLRRRDFLDASVRSSTSKK